MRDNPYHHIYSRMLTEDHYQDLKKWRIMRQSKRVSINYQKAFIAFALLIVTMTIVIPIMF
ncbi:MAG: hypothetical protein AAFX87_29795 [Bacteroidota bacterium]